MPITQMQHFMVLAKDLEKTRAFYVDALGLRVGMRLSGIGGGWRAAPSDRAARRDEPRG